MFRVQGDGNDIRTDQYRPVEISFESDSGDYGFGGESYLRMHLKHTDGSTHVGEGFWDGGRRWGVRFLPLKSGRYSWRTESGDPGLQGRQGLLEADLARTGSLFADHGPLRTADDGRSFCHQDGRPFFWLGEGLWAVAQQAVEEELDEYFAVRRRQGFSAIQFNTLLNWESSLPYRREPFQRANGRMDLDRYDHSYFRFLDLLFDRCAENGMLAVPVVLWFNYLPGAKPDWYDPPCAWPQFSPEQARRYGRYLGARFGAFPLAWLASGDIATDDPAALDVLRAAIQGIEAASFNPSPIGSHVAAQSAYHRSLAAADWVSFHFMQTGHRIDAVGFPTAYPRAVRKQCRKAPVVNGEMFFESLGYTRQNRMISREVVRRAAWESFLAGANAGISYGAHGLWCWYEEGLEFRMATLWKNPLPWRKALRLPGAEDCARLKDFMTQLKWWDLEEAPDLPIHEEGEEPATVCRLEDGCHVVAYLPRARALRLTDTALQGLPALWLDPAEGARQPVEIRPRPGGVGADPPSWRHDAVLWIGPVPM
jgi:hypothetical protein